MEANKIRNVLLLLLMFCLPAQGQEIVHPYEIPTFTGDKVDWHTIKPAINPLPKVKADYLFTIVNNCYPIKPWGIEVSAKAGINYRAQVAGEITTSDSSPYYAGIVFNMPLYSASEMDKKANREYTRRLKTSDTITKLIRAVAKRRRAERMMGLYLSLEQRSQERVRQGIVSVDEQIKYLEKVAKTQADYDSAIADMEGARISLVAQCRPDVAEQVNSIIVSEISQ